jgi:hypothetical protein
MIEILDDVVPVDIQDRIEQTLLSADTGWILSRSIAYKNNAEVSEETKKSIMGFTHLIFQETVLDNNINLYNEPLIALCGQLNYNIEALFNMRAQLQLPVPSKEKYGSVHVDSHMDRPYKVCLYYVNDSDGDTIIFNERSTTTPTSDVMNGNLTERLRVNPKKGRMIIFDGDIYHCGSKPSNDIRCVINYNIFVNGTRT